MISIILGLILLGNVHASITPTAEEDDCRVFLDQANAQYNNSDFGQALSRYEQVIKHCPDKYSSPYLYAGFIYYKLSLNNDESKAKAMFEKVISFKDAPAINRAKAYYFMAQIDTKKKYFYLLKSYEVKPESFNTAALSLHYSELHLINLAKSIPCVTKNEGENGECDLIKRNKVKYKMLMNKYEAESKRLDKAGK